MQPLVVDGVVVFGDRLEATVRVVEPRCLRTSAFPGVAERALAALPGLERHRCESGHARGIVSELADTEVPHLLEHVTIELMALAGSPRTVRGETSWDFKRDGRGVFRVAIVFDDETRARDALAAGVELVKELLTGGASEQSHEVCEGAD